MQPYLEQIANIETYQDLWEVMSQFQVDSTHVVPFGLILTATVLGCPGIF